MFITLSKLPHVTGTSHRIKANIGSLVFRAVVADTGTPNNTSLYRSSLLFIRGQTRKVGF
ncbi:MAG: hypothetical protein OIN84_02215 [Candidatus Methanoperedens sp.]|nr:hypothetical protein [Candidatus Methanoperedens sp.]